VPELVFYVDVTADDAVNAEQVLRDAKGLPGIGSVDVRAEEPERSLAGIDIAAITLTLTALSGMVGSATLLLNKIQELVKSIRGVHRVLVQTKDGPKPLETVNADDVSSLLSET
jgi:hypothetical protein